MGKHIQLSFSVPMVRAIMAGAKTETRLAFPCAIEPGDVIDVCEALHAVGGMARYVADESPVLRDGEPLAWTWKGRVLQPIYCPSWTVRLRIPLVEVRLEPLGAIDEAGAIREGMAHLPLIPVPRAWEEAKRIACLDGVSLVHAYRAAWETLHGRWEPDGIVQVIRWEAP